MTIDTTSGNQAEILGTPCKLCALTYACHGVPLWIMRESRGFIDHECNSRHAAAALLIVQLVMVDIFAGVVTFVVRLTVVRLMRAMPTTTQA